MTSSGTPSPRSPTSSEGGALIARYMVAIADKAPGLELLERSVNGAPGLVARHAGSVETVASFDIADGRVTRIWVVRNPEKLRPWVRDGQVLSCESRRRTVGAFLTSA